MIPRDMTAVLRARARTFPVVALTGPRQSGKTTLVRKTFPRLPVEIKAGRTVTSHVFESVQWWCRLANRPAREAIVVHGGEESHGAAYGRAVSWRRLDQIPRR